MVVSPAARPPDALPVGTAPGAGADEDGAADADDPAPVPLVAATGMAGTCDLNDSRATRPAMVPVTARITRRMTDRLPQNSNNSTWTCPRGTPAERSASTAAETMPAGPHT